VRTINAHQKTVLKVKYDSVKERLITGGSDSHMKFHDLAEQKVMYTIKLPSEILSMDISSDGQHYSLGLANGTLLVRSRKFEPELDENDELLEPEDLMNKYLAADQQTKRSKDNRYFYRGQYGKEAESDDIIAKGSRKVNLQKYEKFLKKFEYKNALNSALEKNEPDIIVSLMEELIQRSSLEIALSYRSEEELVMLLKFLIWKISDYRFADLLIEVAKITIDMYSCIIGHSTVILDTFKLLQSKISSEIDEQREIISVKSKLDTLKT
jgi:U3 small nucleolar RNA-associated protein 15